MVLLHVILYTRHQCGGYGRQLLVKALDQAFQTYSAQPHKQTVKKGNAIHLAQYSLQKDVTLKDVPEITKLLNLSINSPLAQAIQKQIVLRHDGEECGLGGGSMDIASVHTMAAGSKESKIDHRDKVSSAELRSALKKISNGLWLYGDEKSRIDYDRVLQLFLQHDISKSGFCSKDTLFKVVQRITNAASPGKGGAPASSNAASSSRTGLQVGLYGRRAARRAEAW